MSARVTVAVSTVASPPPAPRTNTGTLFIAGVATGSTDVNRITGISEFREIYGVRATLNGALHDALQSFFAEGGSIAFVKAVPTAPVGPATWSDVLEDFTADLGPGAVAIAGIGASAATAVGAHCDATVRLGLICGPESQAVSVAVTAAAVASGEDGGDRMVYVWPWVNVPGLDDAIEPLGFAAGVRARAHTSPAGAAQSPLFVDYGTSRFVNGVETAVTDAEWATLNTAKVSVVRIVSTKLRQYGWKTVASPVGDASGNLTGAQFRDLLNVITWDASQIAERYVGKIVDGRGVTLGSFSGDLSGMLSRYASSGSLFARLDEVGELLDGGYVVNVGADVNPPNSLATGQLKAEIGVRLSPTAEFVTITIAATDAAGNI
jgi:hypothetical protein